MESLRVDAQTVLKQPSEADVSGLSELVASNGRALRRWLPWLSANPSFENAREFVRESLRRAEDGSGLVLLIQHETETCGVAGFSRIDRENHCAEAGYWLKEGMQGRGLATQAFRIIVEHGFGKLELNRITLLVAPANVRSRAIPRRLGFVHEGVLRQAEWHGDRYVDTEVYSLLREDRERHSETAAADRLGGQPWNP